MYKRIILVGAFILASTALFAQAGKADFDAAESARLNHRYPDAITRYDKAIAKEPQNHQYHYQKGLCLMQMNQFDAAVAAFEGAVKVNPKFETAFENLGNLYAELKKNDQAINSFQKAFEVSTENETKLSYKMQILVLLYERGKYAEAVQHIADAKKLSPESLEIQFFEAQYFNAIGKYKEAIANLEVVTKGLSNDYPDWNARFYYQLGYAMHMLGDYAKADKILREKADYVPYKQKVYELSAEFHYKLAFAYSKVREEEKAVEALNIALAIQPVYPEATTLLNKVKAEKYAPDKVKNLADVQEAAIKKETDPKKIADMYEKLADYQFKGQRYADAVYSCNKALAFNPRNLNAGFLKAVSLARSKEYDEAISVLSDMTKVPEINKNVKASYIFMIGVFYKELGDKQSAAKQFARIKGGPYQFPAKKEMKTMYSESELDSLSSDDDGNDDEEE